MNYLLSTEQKHNLEVNLLNAAMQIQNLINLVKLANPNFVVGNATHECLAQLQRGSITLENLNEANVWEDKEADVQQS